MDTNKHLGKPVLGAAVALAVAVVCGTASAADCSVVAAGLRAPIGSVFSNQGNLIVSETGIAGDQTSGRISIVSPDGTRRTSRHWRAVAGSP